MTLIDATISLLDSYQLVNIMSVFILKNLKLSPTFVRKIFYSVLDNFYDRPSPFCVTVWLTCILLKFYDFANRNRITIWILFQISQRIRNQLKTRQKKLLYQQYLIQCVSHFALFSFGIRNHKFLKLNTCLHRLFN